MTALVAGLVCLFGPPSPVCVDTLAPPPDRGRGLPVRPLGQVRVDVLTATDPLTATLRGQPGELPVAVVGESKQRFVVRLPRRLGQHPTLELHGEDGTFAALLEPPPPAAPPKPVLRAGGERLVMARGSYCWSTPPVGLCVDTLAPVTAKALAVRRGGRLRVDTRLDADVLIASIRRGQRGLHAKRAHGSRRRFVVRLPRRLKSRAVLELFVRYPQGDGNFGARLRLG